MESWLCQVGGSSNIAYNFPTLYMQWYLVIISRNSHDKLTNSEMRISWDGS